MAIQSQIINGSLTEIYAGGGNFITQAFPTNFHKFWIKKILTSSENIEDFKEVTAAQKATIEAADAEWKEPSEEIRAMFSSLTDGEGVYNESTGYLEYDILKDLTENDIRQSIRYRMQAHNNQIKYLYGMAKCRLIFDVPIYNGGGPTSLQSAFISSQCELVSFRPVFGGKETPICTVNNLNYAFQGCLSLKKIMNLYLAAECSTVDAFKNCPKLTHPMIQKLRSSISFTNSANLAMDALDFIVDNAANTAPITITLHPDAYARLTDELIEKASARQITFATTQ